MKGKFFSSGGGMVMSGGGGDAMWGSITGTLSDQTDLQNELDGKSNVGHTHDHDDITDFDTAVGSVVSTLDITSAVVGTIITHPVSPGPDWLECKGQPVAEASYPALYSVLGNLYPAPNFTFGSIGGTTGNVLHRLVLPDKTVLLGRQENTNKILRVEDFESSLGYTTPDLSAFSLAAAAPVQALCHNPLTGTVVALSAYNGTHTYMRSEDGGATWSAPNTTPTLTANGYLGVASGTGFIHVDTGTPTGRMMYPAVVSATMRIVYSDDDGHTWQVSDSLNPHVPPFVSTLTVQLCFGDGVLVLLTGNFTGGISTRYVVTSEDFGITWAPRTSWTDNYRSIHPEVYVAFAAGHFSFTSAMLNGWRLGQYDDYSCPIRLMKPTDTATYCPLLPAAFQGELVNTTSTSDGLLGNWLKIGDYLYILSHRGILKMRGDATHCQAMFNFFTGFSYGNTRFLLDAMGNDDGYFVGLNGNSQSVGRLFADFNSAGVGNFYIPNETQAHGRRWIKAL